MSEKKKMIGDDQYLVKCKQTGLKNEVIAEKMGITPDEVERRFRQLIQIADQIQSNGWVDFQNQFTVLCTHYQLLGESLKAIAQGLQPLTPSEIEHHLAGSSEDIKRSLESLTQNCIILKKFIPVDPIQALEEQTRSIQESN